MKNVALALASAVIATPITTGIELSRTGYIEHSYAAIALLWAFLTIIVFLALFAIHKTLVRKTVSGQASPAPLIQLLCVAWTKKSVLAHAGVMFLCWLPYLIAYAPGTMGFDTYYQIFQFFPGHDPILQNPWWQTESLIPNQFCDHHPIFDTLVFGAFAYLSEMATGSWNAGLLLYALLQMSAMALSFSACCAYLGRITTPRPIRVFAFVFYCLFSPIAMFSVTIIKDTLFSWLFVLYFLMAAEIARSRGKALKGSFVVLFVALSLLLCLTKKTGVYVVIAECIFLLVVHRQRWVPIVATLFISASVMFVVLPMAVFPLLDVAPGGKQEALGIPFQQTARYISDYPDDVSAPERDAIDAVLPYDKLVSLYDPKSSDSVKNSYRWQEASMGDIGRYLAVWASQGLRHPETYVKAVAAIQAPFSDPSRPMNLYFNQGTTVAPDVKASFNDSTKPMRTAIEDAYEFISSAPLVGSLFSNVLYGWIIPASCFTLVLLCNKRREYLAPFFLVLLAIGSYLISPVAWTRYMLPLVYLAPVLLGIVGAAYAPCDNQHNASQQPAKRIAEH